jgi:hypothetical protein
VRFVNTATWNAHPWTRLRSREWEETSITTSVQPSSAICRKRAWRSDDSGVVRVASTSRAPMR